jgi:hypothetical protein
VHRCLAESAQAAPLRRLVVDQNLVLFEYELVNGEAPAGYRPVWEALGLQGPGDLLLVHGEGRWEAKGWGLSGAQISAALDAAEPARDRALGPGLVAALPGLGRAAGLPAEAPAAAEGEGSGALAWVGGAGAPVRLQPRL